MSAARILLRLGWRPLLAVFLLTWMGSAWGDRPRIVVMTRKAPPPARTEIESLLAQRSFSLGGIDWRNPAALASVATASVERTDAELFEALEALRDRADIVAAGEVLTRSPTRITFFTGQLIVHFRSPTSESSARQWGDDLDLRLLDRGPTGRMALYQSHLRPAGVLSLLSQISGSSIVAGIEPVATTLYAPPGPVFTGRGAYQRIPRARNQLVVVLDAPDSATRVLDEVTDEQASSTPSHDGLVLTIRFSGEAEMLGDQKTLRGLPEVTRAGPLVSAKPLAFLTDQIVVKFREDVGRWKAEVALASLGLTETRRLPYVENVYLFRYGDPSYEIYEAARQLVKHLGAAYAVPNLVSIYGLAGCGDSCGAGSEDYLHALQICEPSSPTNPTDWPINVGLLDNGITEATNPCNRLNVARIADLRDPNFCEAPAAGWCSCNVGVDPLIGFHGTEMAYRIGATSVTGDLTRGVAQGVPIVNAVGPSEPKLMTDVAFADALEWLAGADPEWCWDGTNYTCPGESPHVTYDCTATPPDPVCAEPWRVPALSPEQRASVINLSIVRNDFIDVGDATLEPPDENPVAPDPECQQADCVFDPQLVGDGEEALGLLDDTISELTTPGGSAGVRAGGVVIVASVGRDTGECGLSLADPICFENYTSATHRCAEPLTDLPAHEGTIGAGAVQRTSAGLTDWRPLVDGSTCFVQHRGNQVDVVAPTSTPGGSSKAAALVTGVAALMLRQAPTMPAPQVKCLLKETARRLDGPGEIWNDFSAWEDPGCCANRCSDDSDPTLCCVNECKWSGRICAFNGEHSPCVGHGMVSACLAVAAAQACAEDPSSAGCLCTASGSPRLPCTGSSVGLEPSTCRIVVMECDEAGDPEAALSAEVISSRTSIQVLNGAGVVLDEEMLMFVQPDPAILKFVADRLILTGGTQYDPGNGALDVRDGDHFRMIYQDFTDGVPDPAKIRIAEASLDCEELSP